MRKPHYKQSVILYGHITLDHNTLASGETYTQPGGSVYFCAKTLTNLGQNSTVISPYGKDFPKNELPQISFYPPSPNKSHTLIFKNIMSEKGERAQWVENYPASSPIFPQDIPRESIQKSDILLVAPLVDTMKLEHVQEITRRMRSSLKVLLPQGFYRSINKDHKITPKEWKEAPQIIPLFDIIVVSEKDWPQIEILAQEWSKKGPICIVTKEAQGCNIFIESKSVNIPAFKMTNEEILDPTGAGDIFAAAFAFAYTQLSEKFPGEVTIRKSAQFAHATAALSLRFRPNELEYSYQDIIDFAEKQNVNVELY